MSERPISRGRSLASPRVWVNDPNPVFQAGLATCLAQGGYEVVGLSSGRIAEPPPGVADVLVFDLGDPVGAWHFDAGGAVGKRLIGIAAAAPDGHLGVAQLDSVVVRAEATPEVILRAVARAAALRVSRSAVQRHGPG